MSTVAVDDRRTLRNLTLVVGALVGVACLLIVAVAVIA